MLIKAIHHIAGIESKQAVLLENYKGVNIVILKEDQKDNDRQQYCTKYIQVNDKYYYPGTHNMEQLRKFIDDTSDIEQKLLEMFDRCLASEQSPGKGLAEYFGRTEEVLEVCEKIKQKNLERKQQRELEEQQRIQEEQEILRKSLLESADKFKQGQRITASQFLSLCREYAVKLPLKTHGWCIKALCNIQVELSNGNFRCDYQYYKGHKESSVINEYAIDLYKRICSICEYQEVI